MKPIDIFDAMDGLREEYIKETEEAISRQGASRTDQAHGSENAGKVHGKTGLKQVSVMNENPDVQKPQIRKDVTNSRLPVWQRIMAGISVAAVFAVFVGGGWVIVQRAKQSQHGSANSLTESGERNFLGGTGEIHVAVSQGAPKHGLDLMYDDTKVYFQGGKYAADRSGSIVSHAYPTDPGVQETLSHTLYDGEQFYYQDGESLYIMDNAGNKQTEPFYEISTDSVFRVQNPPDDMDSPEGNSMIPEIWITNIQKLRENEYAIRATSNIYEDGEAIYKQSGNEIYRPLESEPTRQREIAPGFPGCITLVRDDIAVAQSQSFGRFLRWDPNLPTGIPTGMDDPAMAEMASSTLMTLGDGETTQPAELGKAWAVHENSIYYMTGTVADHVNYEPSHYAALDIYTNNFIDKGEAVFADFIPGEDEILYVTRDGRGLYRSDYELNEPELLFSYDDSVPAEIRGVVSEAKPLFSLDAADTNYALAALDCPSDTDAAFALFDRISGEMRYFTAEAVAADPVQDNTTPDRTEQEKSVPDETAVQTDAVNALGGSGTLYPVGWNNHGKMLLIRDNDNYYYHYYMQDALCWLSCPLTGGQFKALSTPEDLSENPFYYVISDGERIYTGNLDIVSDGSAENSFDPSDVQDFLHTLNTNAESRGGWRYECKNIWHIRDRYFIVMEDASQFLEDHILSSDNYEVWTDDSGNIISAGKAKKGTMLYYSSDDKREMYAIINGEHELLDCPGYELDDKPDPTAYGRIFDAYCVGDEEFYCAEGNVLYTRVNGQPVLIDETPKNIGWMQLAPDRRFFYQSGDGQNSSDALFLWENGEKKLIYQLEDGNSLVCFGFEPAESGGYNIVLVQSNQNATKMYYVFIDADTYETVKQLTVF